MKKIKTNINGLIILKGKTFYDARGFLRETFKKKIIKKNLVFAIISKSNKNVLRGLHLQTKNAQDKYRPFCSSRCANLDLGNWLNEDYRVSVIEDDDLDDIGDV